MNLKIQIYYKSPDARLLKRTINFINPTASKEKIKEFVNKISGLTKNELKGIYLLSKDILGADPIVDDDELVTQEEIDEILAETFDPPTDLDGVEELEINAILDETFLPADDPDFISADDLQEFFNLWN